MDHIKGIIKTYYAEKIKRLGNTVTVVEHDIEMENADHIVDIGPEQDQMEK